MASYTIAFFGSKPYDEASFNEKNKEFDFELRYYKGHLNKHTHILCFQMRPHIYISIFRLFVGSLQYAGYVLCYPVFFLSWCLLLSLLERALI